MLPGRMGRLLLVIVAVLLSACDEEASDPSTSQHCIMIRMQHINMVYWRNRSAEYGNPVGHVDAMIARFVSANWQCFK